MATRLPSADPTNLRLFEIYADDAAYQSHIASPRFREYFETTQHMITSRKLIETVPGATQREDSEVSMARMLVALFALMPLTASAADQQRISFLEQEVRNLQRQVMALSRQMDEMRSRPERPAAQTPATAAVVPSPGPDQWMDSARWRQVRPGMNELEVIRLLGAPTSMRAEGDARVLLYALEIGTSGFLGGSVTLRDRTVVEVRPPTLQ